MKKYLFKLFAGFIVFLLGATWFYIETIDYSVSSNLSNHISMKVEKLEYEISNDKTFVITNRNSNKNIQLLIDNSITDNKVKVEIDHANILNVASNYYVINDDGKEFNKLDFESALSISKDTVLSLYDLGIDSLRDKTVYNYNLLRYPNIKVYVHENYRENIKFVNTNGEVYNPVK